MESWTHWPGEECLECGSVVEVFTDDSFETNEARDGDAARCVECGAMGMVSVVDDEAYVVWD